MKNWLIKKLGGYTKAEYENELRRQAAAEYEHKLNVMERRTLTEKRLFACTEVSALVDDVAVMKIKQKLCEILGAKLRENDMVEFREKELPNERRVIEGRVEVLAPVGKE